jgi:uncharacterized protein (TIGR00645 family)
MNNNSSLVRTLERLLFGSRWLLLPMNAGLGLVMIVYVMKFLVDTYRLISTGLSMESEAVMVLLLGLVDMFMVANLLVMISQGSYQIFIQRFQIGDAMKRPQWLDHVDSSILKVKIASSIAGITLIRILKDFVNIERTDWSGILHRIYIHGLCLLSALVLGILWRVMHPTELGHKDGNT